MASSDRKLRKLRGHVSHGHGRVGKHRKHPAGRGMAGSLNHHKTLISKYHPGYFGKNGFRDYHNLPGHRRINTINVEKLHTLVNFDQDTDRNASKGLLIDCVAMGISKVLGGGSVINGQPLVVKARYFSEIAEKKIVGAGGACVLVP